MNVALAGLTAREEVALGMLVGKSLHGWQCLPATNGPRAPAFDQTWSALDAHRSQSQPLVLLLLQDQRP